jgi:acyl CoA:acetate/3-ketoacid CoA transferase beta subunit
LPPSSTPIAVGELADGVTVDEVKSKTKAKLSIGPGVKENVA